MPHHRRPVALALLTMTFVVAVASTAAAQDLCIDGTSGNALSLVNPFIILRGFTLPGKNKCKQAQGVLLGFESAVSGSACASSDGAHVTFSLTASTVYEKTGPTDFSGSSTIYGIRLSPRTLLGGVTFSNLNGGMTIGTAFAYECKKSFPDNE